jgi:hypothetical protein
MYDLKFTNYFPESANKYALGMSFNMMLVTCILQPRRITTPIGRVGIFVMPSAFAALVVGMFVGYSRYLVWICK